MKSRPSGTNLYVISADDGRVKVGVSNNPMARTRSLAPPYGHGLTVEYDSGVVSHAPHVEAAAHEKLAQYSLGGEWFSCGVGDAVRAVREAMTEYAGVSPFREWRHRNNLSQWDVAQAVGATLRTVQLWEHQVVWRPARKYCDALLRLGFEWPNDKPKVPS